MNINGPGNSAIPSPQKTADSENVQKERNVKNEICNACLMPLVWTCKKRKHFYHQLFYFLVALKARQTTQQCMTL